MKIHTLLYSFSLFYLCELSFSFSCVFFLSRHNFPKRENIFLIYKHNFRTLTITEAEDKEKKTAARKLGDTIKGILNFLWNILFRHLIFIFIFSLPFVSMSNWCLLFKNKKVNSLYLQFLYFHQNKGLTCCIMLRMKIETLTVFFYQH